MKKIHKIILVVSVCAVLFSMFATSVFADSVNTDDYRYRARALPLCQPRYTYVYSADGSNALADIDTTLLVPYNAMSQDVAWSEKQLYSPDGESIFCRTDYRCYDFEETSRNAYGYTYYPGAFSLDFYDFDIPSGANSNYRIEFTDCFVPGLLVTADWNWLANYRIYDYNYGSYLKFNSLDIGITYSYLSQTTSGSSTNYTFKRVSNKVITLDSSKLPRSDVIWSEIKKAVMTGLKSSDYSLGICLNQINLEFKGVELADGIMVQGNLKWVNPTDVGDALAIRSWSSYYGTKTVYDYSTPTVLESVTRGVNAIWELKIFNTFTLGNIFSACVGILLTRWLLKMFAGG